MVFLKRVQVVILASAAMVITPVAGAMILQDAPVAASAVAATTPEDQTAIFLAQRLCDRVKALAPDSDTTRFEAEMVYGLSQSGTDVKIQAAALERVRTLCPISNGLQVALNNATASIDRGATAGTAALADGLGQGGFDSGSLFSSPVIESGGSSVNYSPS